MAAPSVNRTNMTGPEDENELTFTNNRDKTKWLDGEDTEENQFTIPNAA